MIKLVWHSGKTSSLIKIVCPQCGVANNPDIIVSKFDGLCPSCTNEITIFNVYSGQALCWLTLSQAARLRYSMYGNPS